MAKLGQGERKKNRTALVLIALAVAVIIAGINYAYFMSTGGGSQSRVGGIAAVPAGG
jgi:flagellar basal body-associated protein FliL